MKLRGAAYLIALNVTAAEMRTDTPEEAKKAKVEYIRQVFQGGALIP